MVAINDVVDLGRHGDVAVVTLDYPPVNALAPHLVEGIYDAFTEASADAGVKAIILICAGRTFIAGADLKTIDMPQKVDFYELQDRIENAGKPVIAAIHGTCLGGGMELALTCHYRIAVPTAKLGLPEVNLGLLPGGGGTQRLPRVVGVESALDLLLSGRQVEAPEAFRMKLIDMLSVGSDLKQDALTYARRLVETGAPAKRIRDLTDRIGHATPEIFATVRKTNDAARPGEEAPRAIIRCVEAAAAGDFDAGLEAERIEFHALLAGPQTTALRHVFFAERQAAKVKGIGPDIKAAAMDSVALVGEGAAADALAALFDAAEVDIRRVATVADAPREMIIAVAMTPECPSLPESDEGADRIVGLTLSDRLVEIVRGAGTSPAIVAALIALARRLGKVALVSSDGTSMAVAMKAALDEAIHATEQLGAKRSDIVAALRAFGFRHWPEEPAGTIAPAMLETLLTRIAQLGAELLDRGVAERASDIDILWTAGLGWPAYDGGPMFHSERLRITEAA
jgi:3-hydroxyacyl-CoA dehydrogenase